MVGVCDVNAWPKHVVVSDLDKAASVDHAITIEIIELSNLYANAVMVFIVWPEPAAFGEGIFRANPDVRWAPDSNILEAAMRSNGHAKRPIDCNAAAANESVLSSEKESFDQAAWHAAL